MGPETNEALCDLINAIRKEQSAITARWRPGSLGGMDDIIQIVTVLLKTYLSEIKE